MAGGVGVQQAAEQAGARSQTRRGARGDFGVQAVADLEDNLMPSGASARGLQPGVAEIGHDSRPAPVAVPVRTIGRRDLATDSKPTAWATTVGPASSRATRRASMPARAS